jgi:hypothetical protein
MRTGFIAATALLALLAGCASKVYTQGGVPAAMPARVTSDATAAPIFATELAGPATFLPPLPSAVVILKPDDMARNRAFCDAIAALPTVQEAEAASTVAPNIIRTRWLVQIGEISPTHAKDCDYLTGVYDYARAARLISAVRASEGGFGGPGPYLLMIIPDRTGLHVAGLDGSRYNEAEFGRFIDNWSRALQQSQARITATPDRPGLIRSVVDMVGAILNVITGGTGGLIKGVFAGL